MNVSKGLAASFVSELVEILRVSTIKRILVLVGNVAAKFGKNVLDREGRLTFVKSAYLIGGYILTIQCADLEKD